MNHRVFIGLGSNVGDRYSYLMKALEQLDNHKQIELVNYSSVYETEPVGVTEQASFLNMVAEIKTSLSPKKLLQATQKIEIRLHRVRRKRWGPRTIDLDILLFNDENIRMNDLLIPHPRMHERAFVLVPLAEIAADMHVPIHSCSVSSLQRMLPEQEKETVVLWKHYTNVDINRIKSV